eukprot:6731703-Karenia_brevis.AAC.1
MQSRRSKLRSSVANTAWMTKPELHYTVPVKKCERDSCTRACQAKFANHQRMFSEQCRTRIRKHHNLGLTRAKNGLEM